MDGRNTLVALTGATGFIGRRLMRDLSARGYKVRALLRRPTDVPVDCTSAVIGDIAKPYNMSAALADVAAFIHLAGISPHASGMPEDDYRALNVEASVRLAQAAQRAGVKRFILLSSVRAQAGPTADRVLTEDMEEAPTDAYGRSKLAAERGIAELDIDWVALRLVLVYGEGVTGNMARLVRLARSPMPLPLAALTARRSILALENLVAAVDCVLATPSVIKAPLLVADPDTLTVAEMIAALRLGFGRRAGLVRLPAPLLQAAFRLARHPEIFVRLAHPLVVDTSRLAGHGWTPPVDSRQALAMLARTISANEPGRLAR
jgi:nucleoside-diphosphate-sugar epimerase